MGPYRAAAMFRGGLVDVVEQLFEIATQGFSNPAFKVIRVGSANCHLAPQENAVSIFLRHLPHVSNNGHPNIDGEIAHTINYTGLW